jgi:hypothetical protein
LGTGAFSDSRWASWLTESWLMLVSGMPTWVMNEPTYDASNVVFVVSSRCSEMFHCWT